MTILARSGGFTLRFKDGRYFAGCRNFSYSAAIKHWRARKKQNPPDWCDADLWDAVRRRAARFLLAIEAHRRATTPKRRPAKKPLPRKTRKAVASSRRRAA